MLGHVLVVLLVSFCISLTTGVYLTVDTKKPIFRVDAEYISATLDFSLVAVPPSEPRWRKFDPTNPQVRTLLRGLAPCYLRFGGSTADLAVFTDDEKNRLYNQPTSMQLHSIYRDDIDKLVDLASGTGARLLYDLTLTLRFYQDWDPTNAERLLSYMASRGYGQNVDFELGNEPGEPPNIPITGKQLGRDYLSLAKLVKSYRNFQNSKIVGPDFVSTSSIRNVMPEFLSIAGCNISATTIHQYYFNGLNAPPSEYINPAHFDKIKNSLGFAKRQVQQYSPNKRLPLWYGETADAWHGGTRNVSDRYISGFLWMDKLGLAAQLGVSVVMRQAFYGGFYGLINDNAEPNADYWISYLHNTLVGQNVFSTSVVDQRFKQKKDERLSEFEYNLVDEETGTSLVRLYSHCAKPSDIYSAGALTIFGLNLRNTSTIITLNNFTSISIHQYLLQPAEGNLLSQSVLLNGKVLHLTKDGKLPPLQPDIIPPTAGVVIKLPPLTFGFWVIPNTRLESCMI